MNPFRRIADDLVEKRLWPVAVALVVALVAIPLFVVGGASSSDPGDAQLAALPATGAAEPAASDVRLVGPPAVRARAGELRDPFRRTKKAKKAESSSSSGGSGGSGSSKASGSEAKKSSKGGASTGGAATKPSGSSGSSSSKPSTTKPSRTVKPGSVPSLASRSVYETTARFTGASHDYEHPLDRLSVLGDKADPALLYLGVSRGGEYAVFLLGPGATAGGDDGACIVADTCRAIGLRKGDTLEVSVAVADATTAHYKLEVTALRRVARGTKSAAHRERLQTAKGGRAALKAFAQDDQTAATLGQLRYGPLTGTVALVRSP